jgi:uncharacterized protein (TIGR03905 family)
MKHIIYKPEMVCCREIQFDLDEDVVHNLKFEGGCNGNLKALAILLEGKNARTVIDLLKGNSCGTRQTSCMDQLTKAFENNI